MLIKTEIVLKKDAQQFQNWHRFDHFITNIKSENLFIFTTLNSIAWNVDGLAFAYLFSNHFYAKFGMLEEVSEIDVKVKSREMS